MKIFLPIMILLSCSMNSCWGQRASNDGQRHLGISYLPVGNAQELKFSEEHLKKLHVSHIRFSLHWKHREKTQGKIDWTNLDRRIRFVTKNSLSLLLTIESDGPSWATAKRNKKSATYDDQDAFKSFVESLCKRYPNKIARIQFGNEWQSQWWFVGTAETYIKYSNIVFDMVKKHSPKTEYVLGGFSIGALQELAVMAGRIKTVYLPSKRRFATGAEITQWRESQDAEDKLLRIKKVLAQARYDVLDIHLYDDVENWGTYIDVFKDLVKKTSPKGTLSKNSLIVSEFGGPNLSYETYTDAYHRKQLGKYIQAIWDAGILDAYYFKLVESKDANPAHRKSGLIDSKLKEKPGYFLFAKQSKRLS